MNQISFFLIFAQWFVWTTSNEWNELPHAWLKKIWKEITGDSDIVDIRSSKEGVNNEKRLAGYVIAQYTLFQEGYLRFQMSQGWTWRGMVRDWKEAVKKFTKQVRGKYIVRFKELLTYWVTLVRSKKVGCKKTHQSYFQCARL